MKEEMLYNWETGEYLQHLYQGKYIKENGFS